MVLCVLQHCVDLFESFVQRRFGLADERSHQRSDVENERRTMNGITETFTERGFSRSAHAEKHHPFRPFTVSICGQSPIAKLGQIVKSTETGNFATVKPQCRRLPQHVRLELPNRFRQKHVMFDHGQRERAFGFKSGHSGGGVQHPASVRFVGQFSDDFRRDLSELFLVGKRMFQNDKEFFEFGENLNDRSQNDEKRPRHLAVLDLPLQRLNDLDAAEKAMEIT